RRLRHHSIASVRSFCTLQHLHSLPTRRSSDLQVFHKKNTEVTVPPSSRALDKFLGCNLFSKNVLIYILDGTTIEIYCSEHEAFVPIHEIITEAISPPVPLATFKTCVIIAFNIPEYSSIPPNVIATIVIEMV